jgi:hypothetical protein
MMNNGIDTPKIRPKLDEVYPLTVVSPLTVVVELMTATP